MFVLPLKASNITDRIMHMQSDLNYMDLLLWFQSS